MTHRWFGLQSILLITLSASLMLPTTTHADGLSVTPSAFRFTVDPGANHAETLTITNGGKEPLDLTTDIATVRALRDTGELEFSPIDPTQTVAPNQLTVVPSKATVAAGGTTTLSVIVKTQPTTPPGGYSLGVRVTARAVQSATTSASVKQQSVTTMNVPVLFTVNGAPGVSGVLANFTAQPTTIIGSKPVTFTAQLTNTSTVHAGATGTITIYQGQSAQIVDRIVLPRTLVFPGAQRSISAQWMPNKLKSGSYRAQLDVTLAPSDSSSGVQQLTAATTVTIGSSVWQWIALALGLLLVVGVIALVILRRRRALSGARLVHRLVRQRKLAI